MKSYFALKELFQRMLLTIAIAARGFFSERTKWNLIQNSCSCNCRSPQYSSDPHALYLKFDRDAFKTSVVQGGRGGAMSAMHEINLRE